MTGSSYLELLRLTAPEIVVALAGLLVLVLDLSFLRRATLAIRFRARGGCLLHRMRRSRWGCWRNSLRKAACRPECWWSIR